MHPRTALRWQLATIGGLAAMHVAACLWRGPYKTGTGEAAIVARIVDMDLEMNLPTLFEVTQFLAAAVLLALVARRERRRGNPDHVYWATLAIGFVYLAIDESWSIHERLGPIVRGIYTDLPGFLYFGWMIPGMAIVLAVLVGNLRFLLRLPRHVATGLFLSGAVFIGGAIGVEMLTAHILTRPDPSFTLFVVAVAFEESMEMTGIAMLIGLMLSVLAERQDTIHLRLGVIADATPHAG